MLPFVALAWLLLLLYTSFEPWIPELLLAKHYLTEKIGLGSGFVGKIISIVLYVLLPVWVLLQQCFRLLHELVKAIACLVSALVLLVINAGLDIVLRPITLLSMLAGMTVVGYLSLMSLQVIWPHVAVGIPNVLLYLLHVKLGFSLAMSQLLLVNCIAVIMGVVVGQIVFAAYLPSPISFRGLQTASLILGGGLILASGVAVGVAFIPGVVLTSWLLLPLGLSLFTASYLVLWSVVSKGADIVVGTAFQSCLSKDFKPQFLNHATAFCPIDEMKNWRNKASVAQACQICKAPDPQQIQPV